MGNVKFEEISEIKNDEDLKNKTLESISKLENVTAYFIKNEHPVKILSRLQLRKLSRGRLYKTDEYDAVVVKGYVVARDSNNDKLMELPRLYFFNLPERKDDDYDIRTI